MASPVLFWKTMLEDTKMDATLPTATGVTVYGKTNRVTLLLP